MYINLKALYKNIKKKYNGDKNTVRCKGIMNDKNNKTDLNNIPLQERNNDKALPPIIRNDEGANDANFSDLKPEQIRLSSMAKARSFFDEFAAQKNYTESKKKISDVIGGFPDDDKEFFKKFEHFKKYNKIENAKRNKALVFSIGFIVIAGIFYGLAFVSMNADKNNNINQIESDIITLRGEYQDASAGSSCSMMDNLISPEEKSENGLVPYLIDNDKDGLSDYYELKKSKTEPLNQDSDNDGVIDGAETYFNLNPLSEKSDGKAPDKDLKVEKNFNIDNASIIISGTPSIYNSYFEKSKNISLNGALGLIGNAYEYYTDSTDSKAKISFTYTEDMLDKWSTVEKDLSILKFDSESNSFVPIESSIDKSSKAVEADITGNGIYALGDKNASIADYKSQVLFLIDNSGSMFPKELCKGSEENDVDFKRVDFVLEMLDRFDNNTTFAAGKFTSKYTVLCDMTDNKDAIKRSVENLKNSDEYFTGTEIADSVIKSVSQFKQGNNYRNYIILLTDGMPSFINENKEKEARELCKKSNITLITVGVGKQVDTSYLKSFAEDTNGMYFNATNADALEAIYEKIDDFTSYNQVQITDTNTKIQSVVLADSGFNTKDDILGYKNFRTRDFLGGMSFGISELVSKYYSGTLPEKENDFYVSDEKEVHGYDLSDSGLIADVRINLSEWHSPVLDAYQNYIDRKDKWNFKNITGGCLYHNDETQKYIYSNYLEEAVIDYNFTNDDDSFIKELLKAITFSDIKNITTAQCAVVTPNNGGDDIEVIRAICYYQNLHYYNKCTCYSFSSNGDKALEVLIDELSEGRPAVVTIGSKAVVGTKLLKIDGAADKYKLQIYDCDNPQSEKYIELTGTKVYDSGNSSKTQYIASYNNTELPLCIYIV